MAVCATSRRLEREEGSSTSARRTAELRSRPSAAARDKSLPLTSIRPIGSVSATSARTWARMSNSCRPASTACPQSSTNASTSCSSLESSDHLRHPLLALDALRALTRGHLFVETQIAPDLGSKPGLVRFHRGDTLFADGSNWFEPAVDTLLDWCFSSGFQAEIVASWPDDAPTRCMLRAAPTDGDPEYFRLSYERPLQVSATGWPSLG